MRGSLCFQFANKKKLKKEHLSVQALTVTPTFSLLSSRQAVEATLTIIKVY